MSESKPQGISELEELNKKIEVGPTDLPNEVYLEFKRANSRIPQATIGIYVKTIVKILNTPSLDIFDLEKYHLNDAQYQDLKEEMDHIHAKIGIKKKVEMEELRRIVSQQLYPFLRDFSEFINRKEDKKENLKKAKLFFEGVSELLEQKSVKETIATRWAKVKDMPPSQRYSFSDEIMFYVRGTKLFGDYTDEYFFLKKQAAHSGMAI
jgi:hypothetical protein